MFSWQLLAWTIIEQSHGDAGIPMISHSSCSACSKAKRVFSAASCWDNSIVSTGSNGGVAAGAAAAALLVVVVAMTCRVTACARDEDESPPV